MCGIFGLLDDINNNDNNAVIEENFNTIKHRGPEFSHLQKYKNIVLGFHRLAINGLDNESNQPIVENNCYLVCNGEIYNYQTIIKKFNLSMKTNSDCEVILQLYIKFGIMTTLKLLDGVFAFALYDSNLNKLFIARDRFGVRPLFITNLELIKYNRFYFASEAKALVNLNNNDTISQFTPGTYLEINMDLNNSFAVSYNVKSYYELNTNRDILNKFSYNENMEKYLPIYESFVNAIVKRINNTERPIACLLSGGLDSSLVSYISAKYLYEQKNKQILNTYSIGFEDSVDVFYANEIAKNINSNHNIITVTNEEMVMSIPEVIKQIESYDTTTVRASVPNYLVGKYIKNNTDFKVILGGDGADELMGGYLYLHKSPTPYDFDDEVISLLKNIHYFDGKRADRCMAGFGLEIRLPFLDNIFVDTYLSYNLNDRYLYNNGKEKNLIRKIIEYYEPDFPKSVLYRRKEAFSDGVNATHESWFKNIKQYLNKSTIELIDSKTEENGLTFEQNYYKYIFDSYYPNQDKLIPKYWMPKYTSSTDASAKTLEIY